MKRLLFLSISFFGILFSSCQKQDPITCILSSTPKINLPNTKFFVGETIKLKAENYIYLSDSGFKYIWSGPNGFYSELQNPIITSATTKMSGEYKLIVIKGICQSPETSINIDVIINTVTCTPSNNYINFANNFLSNMSIYGIKGTNYEYGYILEGYNQNINQEIEFSTPYQTKPQTGIYTTVDKNTPLTGSNVRLKTTLKFISTNNIYYSKLGKNVSVTYLDGKMVAVFCDVPFTRATTTDFIASSKITEE